MRLFFRAFGRKARQCVAIRRGVMAAPLILVQIVQVRVLAAELVNNMLSRAEMYVLIDSLIDSLIDRGSSNQCRPP